jgi:hypothetical protein
MPKLEARPGLQSQAQKGYSTTASGKKRYQKKKKKVSTCKVPK